MKNIEYTLKQIEKLGGMERVKKYKIEDGFGFTASFEDPNGNTVELWAV